MNVADQVEEPAVRQRLIARRGVAFQGRYAMLHPLGDVPLRIVELRGVLGGAVDGEEGALAANEQREVDVVPGRVVVANLSLEPAGDVRPDAVAQGVNPTADRWTNLISATGVSFAVTRNGTARHSSPSFLLSPSRH